MSDQMMAPKIIDEKGPAYKIIKEALIELSKTQHLTEEQVVTALGQHLIDINKGLAVYFDGHPFITFIPNISKLN
jgi:hypothetical protein